MRRAAVLAAFVMVVLSAVSWLFAQEVFTAPDGSCALWLLVLAGVLALLAGLRPLRGEPFELRYLVVLAPLLLGTLLMPLTLSAGALVLAGTLALAGLSRLRRGLRLPLDGLFVFGSILVLQGLALGPLLRVAARRPAFGWLATLLAGLLRFLGVDAAASSDAVAIVTIRAVRSFPVTLELLGFPVAALIVIGALVVVLTLMSPRRRIAGTVTVLATAAAYLVLRAAAMLLIFEQLQLHVDYFADTVRVDVLWDPWWQLASFLPLAFLWGFLARPARDEAVPATPPLTLYRPVPHTLALLLACVGVALVVFGACHHEVGRPRAARVLIDEVHSDWEKTTRAPGTRWYGTLSMYNMFSIADYLGYHYDVKRWTRVAGESPARLSDAVLDGVDVLVLKTPTAAYGSDEIDAVVRFVERGGGLFMIAEHTNYIGSAVQLNAIARKLGMGFRHDGVFSLSGDSPYVYVWHRPGLVYHPIVASIPRFRFEVPCSVEAASLATDAVMLSGGLYSRDADYRMENYYPYPTRVSSMKFGPLATFTARDYGRGRVALFTDSTTFSNFSAFYPGRAELVLATVDWLKREHSGGAWRWFVNIFGTLLVAAGVVLLSRLPDRTGDVVLLVSALFLGAAVALGLARTSLRRGFELPRPTASPVHVAFLRRGCACELPVDDFVRDADRSYDLFFQWVLRVRYFPRVRPTLDEALDDDLIVIIDPVAPFDADERAKLRGYLESGGRALVILRTPPEWFSRNAFLRCLNDTLMLARHCAAAAASRSLLAPFGLEPVPDELCLQRLLVDAQGVSTGVVADAVVVKGGRTLFTMAGRPVGAVQEVGRGRLVVIGFGELFRDEGMGMTNATIPDAQTGARYALEFRLLHELLPPETCLPAEVADEVRRDMSP